VGSTFLCSDWLSQIEETYSRESASIHSMCVVWENLAVAYTYLYPTGIFVVVAYTIAVRHELFL
jgi:hypothetical protein